MKLKSALPAIFLVMLAAALWLVPVTPAELAPRRIEVTAKRFQFTPAEITLKKGEPVVLVLNSVDTTHGLQVKELNLETKIRKGQPSELLTKSESSSVIVPCFVARGTEA